MKDVLFLTPLLLVGCASSQAIKPSSFPNGIFPPLCDVLIKQETVDSHMRIFVLARTRPISDMVAVEFAYRAEGEVTLEHLAAAGKLDEIYLDQFQAMRIDVPKPNKQCRWVVAKGSLADYDHSNKLLLEISNPLQNPYADQREEPFGIFVRFSLGGRMGAGWYWISLLPVDEDWRVLRVIALNISDG